MRKIPTIVLILLAILLSVVALSGCSGAGTMTGPPDSVQETEHLEASDFWTGEDATGDGSDADAQPDGSGVMSEEDVWFADFLTSLLFLDQATADETCGWINELGADEYARVFEGFYDPALMDGRPYDVDAAADAFELFCTV